jgi:hypothetical protein
VGSEVTLSPGESRTIRLKATEYCCARCEQIGRTLADDEPPKVERCGHCKTRYPLTPRGGKR